ncbi:MAG: hypothetical protein Q8M66_09055 [Actinomycetota bacterium]|nr:hypothetical protein [Actinomycetota bacterium]MDZ4180994.1 hypothetical protein [Coriobacteriia bacterium]
MRVLSHSISEADPGRSSTVDSAHLFVVERVESADGGVEALLRLTDLSLRRTSAIPGCADELLRHLPGLVRHRCECGSAHGIAAELADTETAHALEHVALELLALDGHPRTTRGHTRWDARRDGRGVYRVFLGIDDPASVSDALGRAAALLSEIANR